MLVLLYVLQTFGVIGPICIFSQGTWVQKASLPAVGRLTAVSFSVGNKGYLGTGGDGGYLNDFWEYDPITDSWAQKANFGGTGRNYAVGFAIGNKGYIGTGYDGTTALDDFWEYDPIANIWAQKANLPGGARVAATSFSVGGKGYIGTGVVFNDIWEYNPATNMWTQKNNFPIGSMAEIDRGPFVIGNKVYLGLGININIGTMPSDFWEYDPITDSWTQKANFPSSGRQGATGFSICNKGFLGLGIDNNFNAQNDFYIYDPATNTWSVITNLPGGKKYDATSFVICNKAYIGTGAYLDSSGTFFRYNDLWEFIFCPSGGVTATINSSSTTICPGSTVTLIAGGGSTYSWSTGSTINPVIVSPSSTTTYSVIVTDVCGSDTASITLNVIQPPVAIISGANTICSDQSIILTASGGTNYSWSNGSTNNPLVVSPPVTTTYSVIVSDVCGNDTASLTVTVLPSAVSQFSFNIIDIDSCNFISVVQFTNNSSNANSWLWNFADGNTSVLQNLTHSYSSSGTYYVMLISNNSFGCSDTSQQAVNIEAIAVPPFFLPNAFSPNSDNENDIFIVQGSECVETFFFAVYNRLGEKVFETIDVTKGWDGTYNGKKENPGVFAYYLEATLISGEVIRKKGNITLLR